MALERTPVPTALTIQPLIAGIEPDIFMPVAGLVALVGFTAQSNWWNILVDLVLAPPIFILLRARTADDPYFFRVLKQGIHSPKYLPAASALYSPEDKLPKR